jgi:hypothetical protein
MFACLSCGLGWCFNGGLARGFKMGFNGDIDGGSMWGFKRRLWKGRRHTCTMLSHVATCVVLFGHARGPRVEVEQKRPMGAPWGSMGFITFFANAMAWCPWEVRFDSSLMSCMLLHVIGTPRDRNPFVVQASWVLPTCRVGTLHGIVFRLPRPFLRALGVCRRAAEPHR